MGPRLDWEAVVEAPLRQFLIDILARAENDFSAIAQRGRKFDATTLHQIRQKAELLFYQELKTQPATTYTDLASAWNCVVADFYHHDCWGFQPVAVSELPKPLSATNRQLVRYARIFLVPTIVIKTALLYFGIHYALYPDRGYGWGLALTMALSVCNFGFFLYQSRNDPEG